MSMSIRRQKHYLKHRTQNARMTDLDIVPTGAHIKSLSPDELVSDPWASVVYEKARLWAKGNGGVDSGSIIVFGIAMIKVIEKLMKPVGHGNGEHKITLLMTVMRLVINNDIEWSNEEDKAAVVSVLEDAVPSFVKEVILIAKGEKDLGKLFGIDWVKCCSRPGVAADEEDEPSILETNAASQALKQRTVQRRKEETVRGVRSRLFAGARILSSTAAVAAETKDDHISKNDVQSTDIMSMFNFENDPRVAQLYAVAKRWARGTEVTSGSVIVFISTMIGVIEQMFTETHMGSYKEDVLVTVLTLVLKNEVKWEDESAKQTVLALMQSTVPMMVRTAIKIAKGEINLGKMFKNCFNCCFGVDADE